MVYEVKCSECGEIIDFGGEEPSEFSAEEKLPDGAIKFQGEIYCEDCVKKFVKFGIGDVEKRVDYLERNMEDLMDAIGMEKNMNPE